MIQVAKIIILRIFKDYSVFTGVKRERGGGNPGGGEGGSGNEGNMGGGGKKMRGDSITLRFLLQSKVSDFFYCTLI